MLSKNNVSVNTKVTRVTLKYIKKYCKLFDISTSSFCQHAIQSYIIHMNDMSEDEFMTVAKYIKQAYDNRRK